MKNRIADSEANKLVRHLRSFNSSALGIARHLRWEKIKLLRINALMKGKWFAYKPSDLDEVLNRRGTYQEKMDMFSGFLVGSFVLSSYYKKRYNLI